MSAKRVPSPIVRSADEGEWRSFAGGGVHIWKATEEETDGAFLLFEMRCGEGKVTPLHIHPESDESMIVLEGEIWMHIDGVQTTVAAGGVAFAPRGVPHAFRVSSAAGVRMLCLHTPGCCEAFYRDASTSVAAGDPNAGVDVDMSRVVASARTNGGMEVVGPPPFD
ncbi:MAG: cupin domain-containing protein [Ilumatobacteraceae bacterium]